MPGAQKAISLFHRKINTVGKPEWALLEPGQCHRTGESPARSAQPEPTMNESSVRPWDRARGGMLLGNDILLWEYTNKRQLFSLE